MADPKVYRLPKSGLRLEGTTLSRVDGEDLIADHELRDFHEVVLKASRNADDLIPFALFGGIFLLCVAGFWFWGWKGGSTVWTLACSSLGLLSGVMVVTGLMTKGWSLILRGATGDVAYRITDEGSAAESFFAEIREHAAAAHLMTGFKVER